VAELTVDQLELAKTITTAQLLTANTAATLCCRMQVDQKPFDDIRVRQAIVKAVDNAAITALIFPEGARRRTITTSARSIRTLPVPALTRDVEGAKALLAEAGHASGLEITISTGNTDGPWHQAVCEVIRDQLKDVGITLSIDVLPSTKFWEVWNKVPFGSTPWDHRPLGRWRSRRPIGRRAVERDALFQPGVRRIAAGAEATFDTEQRRARWNGWKESCRIPPDDPAILAAALRSR
jgi:peptide/nickel transport system substrate-binding protein